MPRIAVEDNRGLQLRIRAEEKALLSRAVALKHTDLTDFVIRHALEAAKAVIEEADHVKLSCGTARGSSICWNIRPRRMQNCLPPVERLPKRS